MRNIIFTILLLAASAASAADLDKDIDFAGPLLLKNGSYLFVNEDNTMRMVDRSGKPVEMKDGVEMELQDGTVLLMTNKKLWRHIHRKMKH